MKFVKIIKLAKILIILLLLLNTGSLSFAKIVKPFNNTLIVLNNTKEFESLLSANIGKVVVLTFWTTWCEDCQNELPVIRDIRANFTNKNIAILPICIDDKIFTLESFLHDVPMNFTVYYDQTGQISEQLKIKSIPTIFILSKNQNKVLYLKVGTIGFDKLRAEIMGALKE